MASLDRLPAEILLQIADFCQRSDLLQFSLASRLCYRICTPALYHTVSLKSHDGPDIETRLRQRVPADWASLRYVPEDERVYRRQLALVRTLQRAPELAALVRVLHWTAVETPLEIYSDDPVYLKAVEEATLCDKEAEENLRRVKEELSFNSCNRYLWDTFALFTNVHTVDLAFVDRYHREQDPPPKLFTTAKSIRLSGMASRYLVTSILDAVEPHALQHLHLNNLNEFSQLSGVNDDLPLRARGKLRPFPAPIGYPGPMRNHLSRFAGRWPNLKSLIIDTVGQVADAAGRQPGQSWDPDAEDQRYEELGEFIRSAAGSLEHFRFQQGLTGDYWKDGWRSSPRIRGGTARHPTFITRPMDRRFMAQIFPAIVESSWPNLRQLQLYGVAGQTSWSPETTLLNGPIGTDEEEQIQKALCSDVRVDIRPDATRCFWLAEKEVGTGDYEIPSDEWTENEDDDEDDNDTIDDL